MVDVTRLVEGVVERLRAAADRLLRSAPKSVAEAESAGREFGRAAGEAMLAAIAAQWGTGHVGPLHTDKRGITREFHRHGNREILTLAGPLKLRRAYYLDRGGPHGGVFPLDEQIGLGSGDMSRELAEIVAQIGAIVPFPEDARLIERTLRIAISPQTARRTTEAIGHELLRQQDQNAAAALSDSKGVEREARSDRVAVSLDGVMAHVGGEWREAKIGAIYQFDSEGEQVGAKKRYVSRIGTPEDLRAPLTLEALRMGAYEASNLVALGDGAPWIWNLVADVFPGATEVLDYYHALEHAAAIARARFGGRKSAVAAWLGMVEARLFRDNVDWLIGQVDKFAREAGPPPKGCSDDDPRQVFATNVDYFRTNRHRMLYASFRARGLPIGSGVVEAGCKSLVQHRMKAAGMRWSVEGADGVLAVRAAALSGVLAKRLRQLPRAAA
jgi:hypothetical protein